jgi:hypothetical protein
MGAKHKMSKFILVPTGAGMEHLSHFLFEQEKIHLTEEEKKLLINLRRKNGNHNSQSAQA